MKNSVVTTKRKSSSGRSMESSVGATICVTRVTLQKTIKKQTKVIIEIKKLEKIAPSKLGKLAGKNIRNLAPLVLFRVRNRDSAYFGNFWDQNITFEKNDQGPKMKECTN